MKSKTFYGIIWYGIASIMVFSVVARGAVQFWPTLTVEIAVFSLALFWLWKINNRNSDRYVEHPVRTSLDLPIVLFFSLAVLSSIPSAYRYASFIALIKLLTMIMVFYLVVNTFNRYMVFRFAILIIVLGTGISAIGLGQWFFGLDHSWWAPQRFLASTYVNHNHFAGFLEMAIPLALSMLAADNSDYVDHARKIWIKPALLLCAGIMFTALVFSQSRGAWVSITVSLLVLGGVLVRKKVVPFAVMAVMAFVFCVGIIYIYAGEDAVSWRLKSVYSVDSEGHEGLSTRNRIWKGASSMIKDSPVTGSGIGTFVWRFPRFRPAGLKTRTHYAHNDYLHMAAEMGVGAVPLMLWTIFGVVLTGLTFTRGRRRRAKKEEYDSVDSVMLGGAVGILSLSIHGLVDFNFHITANMFAVACLAGIIIGRKVRFMRESLPHS